MRITETTRFPHPVLSQETGDFGEGDFSVAFVGQETLGTGALTLEHEIILSEPSISDLVISGQARVGCFVRCIDTYYSELLPLSWPRGQTDFPPGALLNRVTLQPLVWLEQEIRAWDIETIHPEFDPPVDIKRGDVIAVGPEHVMSVGQAKFAPLESIFELRRALEMNQGEIAIDPDGDRIGILVAESTFETIALLRGQSGGMPVVMNAVYLPAVMEVLDMLRATPEQYSGHRWYQPFIAKCDAKGIEVASNISLLDGAQTLLDSPIRALSLLVAEGEA